LFQFWNMPLIKVTQSTFRCLIDHWFLSSSRLEYCKKYEPVSLATRESMMWQVGYVSINPQVCGGWIQQKRSKRSLVTSPCSLVWCCCSSGYNSPTRRIRHIIIGYSANPTPRRSAQFATQPISDISFLWCVTVEATSLDEGSFEKIWCTRPTLSSRQYRWWCCRWTDG
jgi:hypothetical protein